MKKLLKSFMEDNNFGIKEISNITSIDEQTLSNWIDGKSIYIYDKAKLIWIGAKLDDIISIDKLPSNSIRLIELISKYRITQSAICSILSCTKTTLNQYVTGKQDIPDSIMENLEDEIIDIICANDYLFDICSSVISDTLVKRLIRDVNSMKIIPKLDIVLVDNHKLYSSDKKYNELAVKYNALKQKYDAVQKQLSELIEYQNRIKDMSINNSKDYSNGILQTGIEQELWDGEILSILLDILVEYRNDNQNRLRRVDIINDILSANNYSSKTLKNIKDNIVNDIQYIFSTSNATPEHIGPFRNSYEKRNHYKVKIASDDRYQITMSCTPSERYHSCKNISAIITNNFL